MSKRKEYWLLQNIFYNHKKIIRRRWWHSWFGTPGMFVVAKCIVNGSKKDAAAEFGADDFYD